MEDKQLLKLLSERDRRINQNRLKYALPDERIDMLDGTTIFPRDLYPKHVSFLNADSEYFESAFIAANRVGKTRTGIIKQLYHATGQYPDWYKGKRFSTPTRLWICGDRAEAIRDSIQPLILELCPKDCLLQTSALKGIANAIGVYHIKHVSGGTSTISIKTYQAGRTAFEGAACHSIMLDEECPFDIYIECLVRTSTTQGSVFLTFTPDSGVTETVMHFINSTPEDHRFYIMVGWDDIPHMTEEDKAERLKAIPPHMRDCRTKGIPYLGSGAIYPIPEDDFLVKPFAIPEYWPKCYALDPGWGSATQGGQTAVLWAAWNREDATMYVYAEYKRGHAEPIIHAEAIKARGIWMPGLFDPSGNQSSQIDGQAIRTLYTDLGLLLFNANKAVDAGIAKVFQGLSTGRIKIFSSCVQLIEEMRIYRYDDNGKVAKKQKDDLCDALRYLVMSGIGLAQVEPNQDQSPEDFWDPTGRNDTTGY